MPSLEESTRPRDTSVLTRISPSLMQVGQMAGVYPPTPPSPNPFLRTTLPPQMTTEPDRLRQFYNPSVKQSRSMPLAAASNPNIGASAQSQAELFIKQITSPNTNGLNFRGQWLNYVVYQVNDVVLFNISAYVATKVSTNFEPDANLGSWTLLSKNINLRGQWSDGSGTAVSFVQGSAQAQTASLNFGGATTAGNCIVV